MASRADGLGGSFVHGDFDLDQAVLDALPIPVTEVISSHAYGQWVWARQAKVLCKLPDGERVYYFLKVTTGESDFEMTEGQFESDKAIYDVSSTFCPKPFTWGQYKATPGPATYFLLSEFREVGKQPPEPMRFAARLADLHKRSISPTGKFGFHTVTCHGKAPQLTDCWEESWETLYRKQLSHVFEVDRQKQAPYPEYEFYAQLVLEHSVPRLLRPLQSEGRSIKPCLVDGNIWDGNTATDMETGEPFIFDGSAFYAHNEFEFGNWRTPRHRLSSKSSLSSSWYIVWAD
ncbi:Fructosamine kinase-domain-containing protein [Whalleya microplaca]|nr:Fructosamine kinase-domain-containing protein [Whalleya microplaca]